MSTGNWKAIIPTPVVDSDNTDAVITIPPSSNTAYPHIELARLWASYSATPGSARKLTIQSTTGGASPVLTTMAVIYITSSGAAPIDAEGFISPAGKGLVVTLQASGTAGVKGSLAAAARAI